MKIAVGPNGRRWMALTDILSLWVAVGCFVLAAVMAIWSDWFMAKWMSSAGLIALGIGAFNICAMKAMGKA